MAYNKKSKDVKEYTEDFQKTLLQYMISDPSLYVRCQNIVLSDYWNENLRPIVKFIKKYSAEYTSIPTVEQVKGETGFDLPKIQGIKTAEEQWFLNKISDFCRFKAMEALIYEGPSLIESGEYSEVERRAKENMLIGLQQDLGTDYFDNPGERLETMMKKTDTTSTGWRDVDYHLSGGMNRGEITFVAGGPGCLVPETKIRVIRLIKI